MVVSHISFFSKFQGTRFQHSIMSKVKYSSWKPGWATVDPASMASQTEPHKVCNLVNGQWQTDCPSGGRMSVPDPMNKHNPAIFTIPDTKVDDLKPFVDSMKACSKTGLHNPLKNPERYLMYGDISRKVSRNYVMSLYF